MSPTPRLATTFLIAAATSLAAQAPKPKPANDPLASVPGLTALVNRPASEMADVVDRYTADQASLSRRYDASDSPVQRRRMREFFTGWRTRLAEVNFDKLSQEGRVDYVLLDNHLVYQLALLDRQDKLRAETAVLLPFADKLLTLQDTRRELTPVDPKASARLIATIAKQVDSLRGLFDAPDGTWSS